MKYIEKISLPKIKDERGALSFFEERNGLPFDVKRIYFLYEIRSKGVRGEHAHKILKQAIIPIHGSFCLKVDNGSEKEEFILSQPDECVLVSGPVWREISGFSKDGVCLVLASEPYDEDDYIRSYEEFRAFLKL